MTLKVSIAIIGKNEIGREGLRRLLVAEGFLIVAMSADASALRDCDIGKPGIELIIIDAPSISAGHAACRLLRIDFPLARIVLLGDDLSVKTALAAMSVGADGYLARAISCGALARSLELVAYGEKVIPSQTVLALIAADWSNETVTQSTLVCSGDVRLSDRESAVLRCLSRGDANKQIARDLNIAEATVKIHVKAIMRKLGALNRTQAAILGMTSRLVTSPTSRIATGLMQHGRPLHTH